MEIDDIISLSKVRLERAKEFLDDAHDALEKEKYRTVANRSYYAVFHAMRAVLAFNNFDTKSHKGVISEFRRVYIKTGVFSKELSEMITNLFEIRLNSDYEDFYIVVKQDVRDQYSNAEKFIQEIEKYLKEKYK